jgi:hypothetical protein
MCIDCVVCIVIYVGSVGVLSGSSLCCLGGTSEEPLFLELQCSYSPRTDVKTKTILRGRRPQANYTGRATAAYRRSYCQHLRLEGVAWSARRIPMAANLGFLDRSHGHSMSIYSVMNHYVGQLI